MLGLQFAYHCFEWLWRFRIAVTGLTSRGGSLGSRGRRPPIGLRYSQKAYHTLTSGSERPADATLASQQQCSRVYDNDWMLIPQHISRHGVYLARDVHGHSSKVAATDPTSLLDTVYRIALSIPYTAISGIVSS
jgi:hypothetical protein